MNIYESFENLWDRDTYTFERIDRSRMRQNDQKSPKAKTAAARLPAAAADPGPASRVSQGVSHTFSRLHYPRVSCCVVVENRLYRITKLDITVKRKTEFSHRVMYKIICECFLNLKKGGIDCNVFLIPIPNIT